MQKQLSKKEKEFSAYYLELGNGREAAARAGYLIPKKAAGRLLERSEIKKYIHSLLSKREDVADARTGFRRLAFGSVADAVRLLDGERENLDGLDLFMVSDIKIPKGGGMEIKFFDRQKALESLAELEKAGSDDTALPFYSALRKSAAALEITGEDGDSDEA